MKNHLGVSICAGMMIAFTALNFLITYYAPNSDIVEAARETIAERDKYPLKQDQVLYAEVLNKVKSCSVVNDEEGNKFYTCPDKSTVSMVKWTRGSDRKGVVTKYYDKDGRHLLVYGHPNDVY